MLSTDADKCPGLRKEFSDTTGVHSPTSREQGRRFLHREDFFLTHPIIHHSVCNNWWKIFSDPQNWSGVEWRPPRPLHTLLRANWALIRPISISCRWSGTDATLNDPGAATCCAGGGPGFCVDFFRPPLLWLELAIAESESRGRPPGRPPSWGSSPFCSR